MKSRKAKLILIITLLVILISLIILFFTMDNFKKSQNEECQIARKLELNENDSIPTIKDFITNCLSDGTLEFYQNSEKIELENLTSGSYDVKIIINGKTYSSILIVKEVQEEITLNLKDITINENDTYDINMFVDNCSANGEECTLAFVSEEMANYNEAGTYDIEIIAKTNESEIKKTVKLTIVKQDSALEENINNENNISQNDNQNNNQNNNSNNTSTNDTPVNNYNPPVSNSPTIINSTSEETRSNSYKYGATITTITTSYYDIYSDNSKKKTGETTRTEYNFSTFNAKTSDLKAEAASLVNSNMSSLNEVTSYVNQYRSEVNVQNITLDYNLSIAATVRALEMGWSDTFSHTRPDGTSCFTVVDELGIYYFTAGENIAKGKGYHSPAAVANGWRNSQGHYENMINSNFNKIGVGLAIVNNTYYWVQLFTN